MGRFTRALMTIAMACLVSGCAAGPALFGSQTGTVTGHVTLRACGGAHRADQNGCHVGPAEGVELIFSDGSQQGRTVRTDAGGNYHTELAPGSYRVLVGFKNPGLAQASGSSPRFSGPSTVSVTAGKTVTADFTGTIELL
jgi:hypothetical protein